MIDDTDAKVEHLGGETPDNRQHSSQAISIDWARQMESRTRAMGTPDDNATQVFQGTYLPGQEIVREQGGSLRRIERGLIDPEEYVLRVGTEADAGNLVAAVTDEKRKIKEFMKTNYGQEGNPNAPSTVEIIFGYLENPGTLQRHPVIDVSQGLESTKLNLRLEQNLEFVRGETVDPTSVTGETFSPTQQTLSQNPDLPSGIGMGTRTGEIRIHQRAPIGRTVFSQPMELEIDVARDNLWVVALDANKLEEQQRK